MANSTMDLRSKDSNANVKIKEQKNQPATQSRLSQGQIHMAWEAPEYVVFKKTTFWHIGFGVLLALLLFSAFIMQSFLTGVIFLLSGILIFIHSERQPKNIAYDLRTSGIKIGSRIYLYRELAAFNVVEHGDSIYLLLKSKRLILPLIHIPLPATVNHEEVVEILANYLPQDPDFVEPLADILAHWLGF